MSRALLRSGRAMKRVRATHHQRDLRYGATASFQCSCMSLMSVCWNIVISVTTWDGTDLDMILENGDQLFKSLNQYRLLGIDNLPRTVSIHSYSVDIFLLDNKTGEITLYAYLVSLKGIIDSCLNIGSGVLLIIRGYIFGLLWGKECVYLFDSHSKDFGGNISQNGYAILMNFETLNDLQDYIKLIYYNILHLKNSIFRCNSSVLDLQIILEKALNQN